MTDSSVAIDYLTTRRAMGYKFAYQGQMVGQFAAHLDGIGAEHLTIDHALAWATLPAGAAPVWWAVRLGTRLASLEVLGARWPSCLVHPGSPGRPSGLDSRASRHYATCSAHSHAR